MAKTNRDVTVQGRLSYPALFEPRKVSEESDKKSYSASILIPKTDTATIQAIQAAIQAAVQQGVAEGKFKQAIDPAHTSHPPLRDGDGMNRNGEPHGSEYHGHWFINAKSPEGRKPFVVDQNVQPIIDQSEIYPGCYVNAALQFYPYNHKTGGVGISASLQGVQKVKDGEPLGGGVVDANELFSAIPVPAAPAAQTGGFGQQQPQAQQQAPATGNLGF